MECPHVAVQSRAYSQHVRANLTPRGHIYLSVGVVAVSAITLPRLVGTRAAADSLIEQAGLDAPAEEVTLFARAVSSAAPSFADELVRKLLELGVHRMRVVGSSDRLLQYLRESAERRGSMEVLPTSASDLITG